MAGPCVTIVQLIDADLHLSWQESLALSQSLAAISCQDGQVKGGANAFEQFAIDASAEVVCVSDRCAAISLSELALFLGQLLPSGDEGGERAPAGIQFAIGRALGLVEAPPFVSVQQFSRALQRFEREDRSALLRRVLDRYRSARAAPSAEAASLPSKPSSTPGPLRVPARVAERPVGGRENELATSASARAAERRTGGPSPDMMRRLLREADRARFASAVDVRQSARQISTQSRGAGAGNARENGPSPEMLRRFLREADRRTYELSRAERRRRPRRGTPYAVVGLAALVALGVGLAERSDLWNSARTISNDAVRNQQSPKAQIPQGTSGRAPDTRSGLRSVPPPRHPASRPAPSRDWEPPSSNGHLVQALDVGERPVFSPSFAENSSAVFFDEPGTTGSAVMEAQANDNGGLHVVSVIDDGARNYHPQLSPDGQTIAFDSDRDGTRGVYLASRDGHNVRRISGPGYAAVPTWSPDGGRLAFIRAEDSKPKVWNIWLLNLRSGVLNRLTSYPYGQPWGASWFRDGRRICYAHEDTLIVLDLVTRQSHAYRSPRPKTLLRTPAVSPDGRCAIFQVYRDGAWLIDFTDGSMRKVLEDPSAEEFAWSPDGREVAFHSRRDGEWGVWFIGVS